MMKWIIFLLCVLGPSGSLAIFGGTSAAVKQFPFMVHLRSTVATKHEPQNVEAISYCGGTILSSRVILTAAHCVDNVDLARSNQWILVTAGDINQGLGIMEISPRRQMGFVDKIIIHSEFTEMYDEMGVHDIALLILSHPLELNEFVSPIRIPASGHEFEGDALTCGWGRTTPNSPPSNTLFMTKVGIMDDAECLNKINELQIYFYIKATITHNTTQVAPTPLEKVSQICTSSYNGSRPCKGDSGGPLLCYTPADEEPYLCGITSWGDDESCGNLDAPTSMFTTVAKYIDWINLKLNESNLSQQSPTPTHTSPRPRGDVEYDNDSKEKAPNLGTSDGLDGIAVGLICAVAAIVLIVLCITAAILLMKRKFKKQEPDMNAVGSEL